MLNFTSEDFPDYDIVLKTSDDVLLYVHRLILQLGSPFFKDMFSLPQSDVTPARKVINPINIAEDAETLRQLLSLIYPCGDELRIGDMTLARQVHLLNVSSKYSFDLITSKIASVLAERAIQSPNEAFTIFAVGRIFDLPEVVRVASTTCLEVAILELNLNFPEVTGTDAEDDPTTSLGIERAGLRDVLDRFRASDFQQLLNFYRYRVAAMKNGDPIGYTTFNPCRRRPPCTEQIRACINGYVSTEVEKRGPGSIKQFLSSQFLADRLPDGDICEACWRSLSTTYGPLRQLIESYIIEQLKAADNLPTFGS